MRSVFKFPVILTLTLIFQVSQAQYCGNSGSFQCTPVSVSPNPGFYPPVDSFPVFVNNYISTAAFQFRNFDTIVFGNELLNVHALTFDTIDNLPPGLCWATDQPSNTYGNSQNGCITINGTPCGATGQYKLRVIVTVDIGIPVQTDGGPGGLIYF
ncbi:MAG: hypothetical protein JWO06_856, partial [Bacteroidota bacterium]|nr:hypothetical protein [Bacteroidota bacterium]